MSVLKSETIANGPVQIVSDIHSNFPQLKTLLDEGLFDGDAQIILIGDFLDGFGSPEVNQPKETIQLIRQLVKERHVKLVVGNHDQWLIDLVNGNGRFVLAEWKINGGQYTLQKLGYQGSVDNTQMVTDFLKANYSDFIDVLNAAPNLIENDHLIAVHAGIDWALSDCHNTLMRDSQWMRGQFYLNEQQDDTHHNTTGKSIVVGHTPVFHIDDQKYPHLNAGKTMTDIKISRYKNEAPIYLIDGGSNSDNPNGRINILTLNN